MTITFCILSSSSIFFYKDKTEKTFDPNLLSAAAGTAFENDRDQDNFNVGPMTV